uniref:Uncharacterized protein n=1 Tax=Anguilla anguilla TaxID=7936 RepID=A0A0E9SEB2_ANGAN
MHTHTHHFPKCPDTRK